MKFVHNIDDGDLEYLRAIVGDVRASADRLTGVLESFRALRFNVTARLFGFNVFSIEGGFK